MNRGEVRKEDAELAEAAKRKAGGNDQLARLFEVKKSATSQWGRTRNIPRARRRQLEEFISGSRAEVHRCQFLDFAAAVAQADYIRRTVLALLPDKKDRKKAARVLSEAERLKQLETE